MRFSIRAVLLLITFVAVLLAFQTRAIRRSNEAAARLRDRGGQFEFTPITLKHWATNSVPQVKEMVFMGPSVTDDAINDIVDVANTFRTQRISLVETLVTPEGIRELKGRLANTVFHVLTPGPDSQRWMDQRR